ncbi:MAG: hypothetical protein ACOYM4_20250, partial [Nodosilinea sp.]
RGAGGEGQNYGSQRGLGLYDNFALALTAVVVEDVKGKVNQHSIPIYVANQSHQGIEHSY